MKEEFPNVFDTKLEDLITKNYTLEEAGELLRPRLNDMTLFQFMRVKKMIYRNGFPSKELIKEGYLKGKKAEHSMYKALITNKGLEYIQNIWSKTENGWG
jgi:phage antirepressor YoqD-like protein